MATRSSILVLFAVLLMALTISVTTGMAAVINEEEIDIVEEEVGETPQCWIASTCGGSAINSIKESGNGTSNHHLYWLRYNNPNNPTNKRVFKWTPKTGKKCPLKIVHKYKHKPAYNGNTCTPFAIPFWGGDVCIGHWNYSVKSDGGNCSGSFNVTK